jgi:DNA polymerase-3 subunit beta
MKKITINTKLLLNAVAVANNYTSKDGEHAGAITLTGDNNSLEVKATDGLQNIVFKNIGFVSSDLADPSFKTITLDGKKLATVLKVAKTNDVVIEMQKEAIFVKSNRSRVKIETHAKTQEVEVEKNYGKPLEIAACIQRMDSLLHAIDQNNPKYELNGLLIQAENGRVNMVSTDTKRLAVVSSSAQMDDTQIILPKQAVATISKLFSEDEVVTEADDVFFSIHSESISYSTKLINGSYPEYKRIIPQSFSQEVTFNANDFAEAVSEASMFENDIVIVVKNQILTISDFKQDTRVVLPKDESISQNTEICFAINAKYILDFIVAANTEILELCFNAHNTPLVLKAEDLQEIVMPIVDFPNEMEDQVEEAA